MEIVKAIWKKRNLGIDCYETVLSNEDFISHDSIFTELNKAQYKNSLSNLTGFGMPLQMRYVYCENILFQRKSSLRRILSTIQTN